MSDSLKQLKERIYNEGTIGQLLEELGCDNIKIHNGRSGDDLVTARLPSSNNARGVQIYMSPNLHTELVGRGISGDIYALVGYLLYDCKNFDEVRTKLYQIKTYICNALGYEHTSNDFNDEPKNDWNWWLRDIQKQRAKVYEVTQNPLLDSSVLEELLTYPWYGWYKEGINIETQIEFGIGFHIPTSRVSIPIHNNKGELIGIKGRYVGQEKDLLDHKKYSYIYPCSKTIELFNYHRAIKYIMEKKKVYVVEGAKSVMQLWSWGIKNAVSIEGDKISPVQVKLLKELGLDIDLIFMWDKGKDEDFIKNQLRQFKSRRVLYLYDNKDRFLDKQSPVDNGIDMFKDLLIHDKHTYTA
ncbi:hypothetical protein [Paenibacillus sp. Marseille-Q4541]|uniref:hypothetical protein n=1 Tax=Paenibacillus sp. Marseille-Q4541 TaxID=2831522 RepID=UPI001BAB40CC|nr:hypothetical protein [Paenibacillus sp. Marseille-Q4541]